MPYTSGVRIVSSAFCVRRKAKGKYERPIEISRCFEVGRRGEEKNARTTMVISIHTRIDKLINDKLYLCYSVPVKSYRFCCTHTRLSVYRTRGDAGVGREEQQEEDVEQTGGETKKKKKKKTRQQIRAPTHSGNFRNGIACIYI